MSVSQYVAQAFWLAAPVALTGILHMVVVKKDLFRALKVPIDGGATLGGERIFGDNKTWRGLVFMIAGSAALGALQGVLGGPWAERTGAAPLDFSAPARAGRDALGLAAGYALVNAVLGLGYALGELPNSFVKRRIGIDPGKTSRGALGGAFLVVDQADSVVAALGIAALAFSIAWQVFVAGVIALTLLHLVINAALYFGGLRKNL